MIVRAGYERELIGSHYKSQLETIRAKGYVHEEMWRAFLHLYFVFSNHKYPFARLVVVLSYAVGFGCLAIPSAEVFARVVGIVFGWTTALI